MTGVHRLTDGERDKKEGVHRLTDGRVLKAVRKKENRNTYWKPVESTENVIYLRAHARTPVKLFKLRHSQKDVSGLRRQSDVEPFLGGLVL